MENKKRGFEKIDTSRYDETILLPLRGTKTSAGYDFFTPVDLEIPPQSKLLVWTDVKSYMQEGEVLLLDVRSSAGIKLDLMLANTLGIVDSDYFNNNTNEGNIGICLRNLKPTMELMGEHIVYIKDIYGNEQELQIPVIKDLKEENTVRIKAGDRVAQGIFVNFLESDNCNTEVERTGGIGSTNK